MDSPGIAVMYKSGVHLRAKEEKLPEKKNNNPKGLCSSKGEGCF